MSLLNYGPHYELPSPELAKWLDEHGADCWWAVDGDPLLTGRLSIPCPGDELARELRIINKPLFVADTRQNNPEAKGQVISAAKLDELVGFTVGPPGHELPEGDRPRYFWLKWKHDGKGWVLWEDRATTETSKRDALEAQEAT